MTADRGQRVNCRRLGESVMQDARMQDRKGKAARAAMDLRGGQLPVDDGVCEMCTPYATKVCRFPMLALSVHYAGRQW